MRYVLGFNGPPQIGKSWTCNALVDLLGKDICKKTALMTVPWKRFRETYEHIITPAAVGEVDWDDYEGFKKTIFRSNGYIKTGRELFIDYVEGERVNDPIIWCKAYMDAHRDDPQSVHIIESVGFSIESLFFERAVESFRLCTIAPQEFTYGMQYPKDSRVYLEPSPGLRFVSSQLAYEHFQRRVEYVRGTKSDTTEQISADEFWNTISLG